MRDSGLKVIVGAGSRDRFPDWDLVVKDGFMVYDFAEATHMADVVHVLLVHLVQSSVYREFVHQNLKPSATLSFAHGFNVLYWPIQPPPNVNVVMFVPNSPGYMVREKFLAGSGV